MSVGLRDLTDYQAQASLRSNAHANKNELRSRINKSHSIFKVSKSSFETSQEYRIMYKSKGNHERMT